MDYLFGIERKRRRDYKMISIDIREEP